MANAPNCEKDGCAAVKEQHKKAYEFLTRGLQIDEENGPPEKALQQYKKGLKELEAGCLIKISGSDAAAERARTLQTKMEKNRQSVTDRVRELESVKPEKPNSKRHCPTAPTRSTSAKAKEVTASSSPRSRPRRPISGAAAVIPPPTGAARSTKVHPPAAVKQSSASARSKLKPSDFKNVDSKMAHTILDEIVEQPSGESIKMADIVGQESAKQALKEAVLLPALRPDLFTGLRTPTRGLLLFGPPGNGKTLLAKAVCAEGDITFFNISAATLMSKWVGEAEKMVRALFAMAAALQPSLVFLDEVDSVLSKRKENENDVSRRLKTQFLLEFDGVRSAAADQRVLVMGATNRPWELDDAVLRRFGKRVYIHMPEVEARKVLLEELLAKQDSKLNQKELNWAGLNTVGYSASDITNLAKDAALGPLRELDADQLMSINAGKVRQLGLQDVRDAMQRVRPSVPQDSLKEFDEWNSKYGDLTANANS